MGIVLCQFMLLLWLLTKTIISACPTSCLCNGTVVSCAGLGLTTWPQYLPYNTLYLTLTNNAIQHIPLKFTSVFNDLARLSLSSNNITKMSSLNLMGLTDLEELNLSYNKITVIKSSWLPRKLQALDLSHNAIQEIHNGAFSNMNSLLRLDISNNLLHHIGNESFEDINSLLEMNISHNRLHGLSPRHFRPLIVLKSLTISGNAISELTRDLFVYNRYLTDLDMSSLSGLKNLPAVLFSNQPNLTSIHLHHNPDLTYIHVELFKNNPNLVYIDVSHNSLSSVYERTFYHLKKMYALILKGNPINCNCAAKWLKTKYTNSSHNHTTPICNSPKHLYGKPITKIQPTDFYCSNVSISNYTKDINQKIGSSLILRCQADGDPVPMIKWMTPKGQLFKHNDFYRGQKPSDLTERDVFNKTYHKDHSWHSTFNPSIDQNQPQRIKILDNGDLYIDYVSRSDAGVYYCRAHNPGSNATVSMTFHLDYSILSTIYMFGGIYGGAGAILVLICSIMGCLIKACVKRCAQHKRVKKSQRIIRSTLDNLEAYRTTRMDKLKVNYHHQIGKIREQCSQQLDKLRDSYHTQVIKIKGNCSQQMQKVRENYQTRVSKVKDYSSSKSQKIRENYHNQKAKIRDYGSLRLKKLHNNYKTQQQHLVKLIEMMNLDNCKGVVESDCVRSESMLLDNLDYQDETPSDSQNNLQTDEAEYFTASESSSLKDDQCSTIDLNSHQTTTENPDYDPVCDTESGMEIVNQQQQLTDHDCSGIVPRIIVIQNDTISEDTSLSSDFPIDNVCMESEV